MTTFLTRPRTKSAFLQLSGVEAYAAATLEWAVARPELTFLGARVMHLLAPDSDDVVASLPITGVTLSADHVELVGFRTVDVDGSSTNTLILRQRLFIETVPKEARSLFSGRFPSVSTAIPLDSIYTLITFPVDADTGLPSGLTAAMDATQD